ncbi:hypothetical protein Peur_030441 [Populus x canadensis]
MAENLETWNISSSDPYLYELPSAISAPKVKDLWWTGDPHESEESARRRKHLKSLIYCAARFLQCLSEARFLRINTCVLRFFLISFVPVPVCFVFFDDLRLFVAADFLYAKRLSNGFQEATPLGSANRWFICTPSSNHSLFPQRIA